jgi:hypothetical protein
LNFKLKGLVCLPQQIFIPGLDLPEAAQSHEKDVESSQSIKNEKSDASEPKQMLTNTQARINMLPYNFNEDQLNDLFDLFSSNKMNAANQENFHGNNQANSQNNAAFVNNFDYLNSNNEFIPSSHNQNLINNEADLSTTSKIMKTISSSESTTTTSTVTTPTTTTTTTTITIKKKADYFQPIDSPFSKSPLYHQTQPLIFSSPLTNLTSPFPPFLYNKNDRKIYPDAMRKDAPPILNDGLNVYNTNPPFSIPTGVNEFFYKANRNSNPMEASLPLQQNMVSSSSENQLDLSSSRPFYKVDSNEYIKNKIPLPLDSINLNNRKCKNNKNLKEPDQLYCNMYHTCLNDETQKTMLCSDGFLFSVDTFKCEKKSLVNCGKRLALEFDRTNIQYAELMNNIYQMVPTPRVINGSLECSLGIDGYFADPEFWYFLLKFLSSI